MNETQPRRYFRKLVGKRCYLSPINVDDAERYCEWLNDMEVARTLSLAPMNISLGAEREALERLSREHNYAIVLEDSDELIGNCGLIDLNHRDRACEIGIFIGSKDYWGRGYGPEAMQLLMQYAFDYLNIRTILLRAYSFNERGIAAYRKLGFREVGTWRKAIAREGAEHDVIFMDILAEEFRAQDHDD
ncbi:MAG: GNAT family N-acetyltransferase [Spirochaetota bacterium]